MKKIVVLVSTILFILNHYSCGKDCTLSAKKKCICTSDYTPVCGCDNVTYGNRCLAECEGGITETTPGACK